MNRTPVESSNIAAIGHDPATNTLHVEFKGCNGAPNRLYEYRGISAAEHQSLINAPSIGYHFHAHVRLHNRGTRIS
jgi:KTSC domain